MNRSRRTFVRRRKHLGRLWGNARKACRNLIAFERLEERTLLAGNLNPWHNLANPLDVDADTYVAPKDVLHIVNALNNGGPRQLGDLVSSTGILAGNAASSEGEGKARLMVDVNDDQALTPRDALLVVNVVNAEGEGALARIEVRIAQDIPALTTGPTNRQDVTTVSPGTIVRAEIYADDLRTSGTAQAPLGVYAVYSDLTFPATAFTVGSGPAVNDTGKTKPAFDGSYQNPNFLASLPSGGIDTTVWRYSDGAQGDVATAGLINDMGGFGGSTVPGPDRYFVVDARLKVESFTIGNDTITVPEGQTRGANVLTNDVLISGRQVITIGLPSTAGGAGNGTENLIVVPTADGADAHTLTAAEIQYVNDEVTVNNPGVMAVASFTQGTRGSVARDTVNTNLLGYTATAGLGAGTDTFTYVATDGQGNNKTATVTVTITEVNDPPTLNVISNLTINEDPGEQTVNLTGISAGGTESQPLQVSAVSSNTTLIPAFTINYTSPDPTGTLKFTPGANQNGTALVTVTVTDGGPDLNLATGADNATFSRSFTVTVNALNDPPVNTVPGAQTVMNNAPFVFSAGNGNGISTLDPDGNVNVVTDLTVTAGSLAVKQGGGATITPLSAPTGVRIAGTVSQVNDALSVVTYTAPVQAPPGFVGQVTLVVDTNDQGNIGAGGVMTGHDEVTLNVVPPRQPFAANDTATVAEDSSNNTIDVLVNDIPTAGGTLSITHLNGTAVGVVVNTTHGSVTLNGEGTSVLYTPTADYFNGDSFTYTIADSNGGEGPHIGTVTVTVTPVNDPPTLNVSGTSRQTNEDTALTFNPTTTFTVADIDADASGGVQVTATVAHGNVTVGAASGATVTGSGSASVTITGLIAQVNGALASLSYTPAQDYNGSDSLNVVVNDQGHTGGGNLTASGTVTITVNAVNDAPTMTAPANAATMENVSLPFPAGGASEISVADVDNASLTVDLTATHGTLTLTPTTGLTTVTGDNTAAVHMVGPLASLNAALNGLRYNPTPDFEGDATVIVTAHDDEPLSVSKTVSIVVSGINDPPVITSPGNQTIAEDTQLTFNGNLSVSDVDGGAFDENVGLSVTRGTVTVNAAAGVTITGNASGAVNLVGPLAGINAALNGAHYRAPQDFNTPDTGISPVLTITANDNGHTGTGGAQTDTKSFTITVNSVNDNPTAVDDYSAANPLLVLQNSSTQPITVLANDSFAPDVNETLTITGKTNGARGTVAISADGQTVTYTHTSGTLGADSFTYTISDGHGGTATATVFVNVVDFVPSDVSGEVYFDNDDNGAHDAGELGVGGVVVTLTGVDVQGSNVNLTTRTDANGHYEFLDVLPCRQAGTYRLTETQPIGLVDGTDSLGNQTGSIAGNDALNIFLPLFGYAAGDDGTGNDFRELALEGQTAWLALGDLLHSQDPASGSPASQGMLFAMDAAGNIEWFVNLGGWDGYVPGRASVTDATQYYTEIVGASLDVTHVASALTATAHTDQQILQQSVGTSTVVRMVGATADWTMQAAAGEGEIAPQVEDGLAASANAAQYAQQVDAVFSELGDLI